jgi:hypothetical protein
VDYADQFGRIVVRIADPDKVSHYVQFTVNAIAEKRPRVQTSIVNYFPPGTAERPGTHLADYERRIENGTARFVKSTRGNTVACYQCHASGVLAIHPWAPGEQPDVSYSLGATNIGELNGVYAGAAALMNAKILSEYTAKLGVVEAPERLGPLWLGTPNESDGCTTDELAAVAKTTTRRDTAEVKCIACHKDRGAVMPTKDNFSTLLAKYILGGYMPPRLDGSELAPNDHPAELRTAALACFEKSYDTRLRSWLRAEACE